jgi:hypothetical protein
MALVTQRGVPRLVLATALFAFTAFMNPRVGWLGVPLSAGMAMGAGRAPRGCAACVLIIAVFAGAFALPVPRSDPSDSLAAIFQMGMLLPTWVLLVSLLTVEVFAVRAVVSDGPPAAAWVQAGLGVGGGLVSLAFADAPGPEHVTVLLAPGAWLVALMWSLLPRAPTASRVVAAVVLSHWLFQLGFGIDRPPVPKEHWLVPGPMGARLLQQPRLQAEPFVLLIQYESKLQSPPLPQCGRGFSSGRAHDVLRFSLASALLGKEPSETIVHTMVVTPHGQMCNSARRQFATGRASVAVEPARAPLLRRRAADRRIPPAKTAGSTPRGRV